MKMRILLIGLVSSILLFSDCDFGFDLDFSYAGSYYPYYYDSSYAYPTTFSQIYFYPDSIEFYGDLSAAVYFSAIAYDTMVIDSVNYGIDDMENVEKRYYNRKIDSRIVHITDENCMEDISVQPDSVSFTVHNDREYVFCFYINDLKRDSFSFLYGYFYHHIPSAESAAADSSDFYFEFVTPD